mgnify:CR=1 FL=1
MFLADFAALAAFVGVSFIIFGLTNRSAATQADLLEARLAQFTETGRHISSLTEAELSLPFADRVIKPVFDKLGRIMSRRMQGGKQQAIQARRHLAGRAPQRLFAAALHRHRLDHGHAEFFGQLVGIDLDAAYLGYVHHIPRQHPRQAAPLNLQPQTQAQAQAGRTHAHNEA